ncbi:MAG: RecX family transcriptional regulator [Flavobacteriales bacterium]|nr:RecX family transcriptional regulator [Flavobacteriales bacterium]
MGAPLSAPDALVKARAYCARQERAQQEVRDKLYAWELSGKDVEAIISQLIAEGYLNEARFAEHFAVSKLRQKAWGKRKVEHALRLKRVSEPCIRAALAAIADDEHLAQLGKLAAKRWAQRKDVDPRARRMNVMRYLLAKGYPSDAIVRELDRLEQDK